MEGNGTIKSKMRTVEKRVCGTECNIHRTRGSVEALVVLDDGSPTANPSCPGESAQGLPGRWIHRAVKCRLWS